MLYCCKKSLSKETSFNLKFKKFPFCTVSIILKIIRKPIISNVALVIRESEAMEGIRKFPYNPLPASQPDQGRINSLKPEIYGPGTALVYGNLHKRDSLESVEYCTDHG